MIETIKWVAIGYAALVVIGVGAIALWWRRINRQRAAAIAAMEARRDAHARTSRWIGSGAPPKRNPSTPRPDASSASAGPNYDAPLPYLVDSWPSAPAESHGHSFTGGGGSFDGGGASGDWGSSSSDSSSSYSSSDNGSSSSDSGSCGGGD